jgi:hypothetical protein
MNQEKYLIIGVIFAFVAVLLLSGCTSFAFICEEQSRQELNTCNIDCGEGILSEFCKTKCTIEHNARLDECVGN